MLLENQNNIIYEYNMYFRCNMHVQIGEFLKKSGGEMKKAF